MSCCRLETERLLLRPYEAGDIAAIVPLLNDFAVSKNLARVPHPYTEEDAKTFIAMSEERRALGEGFAFVVSRKADSMLLGGCGLILEEGVFELGYWLGASFWRQGYATEAARRTAAFAFKSLKVARLKASYAHDNPASGRVLAKLGAEPAGVESRDCLSRGHAVYCHKVVLERDNFRPQR